MLHDRHCLLPLIEVLDSCTYPFSFPIPLLDLLILFHIFPEMRFFLEQVIRCMELLFYLLYFLCCFLFPSLLHYWWSGRCEMLSNILDLLLVLIDCLHNLINFIFRRKFGLLRILWDLLVGYNNFLFQSLHTFLPFFGIELGLLEYQF
jgi:hypothetical protein